MIYDRRFYEMKLRYGKNLLCYNKHFYIYYLNCIAYHWCTKFISIIKTLEPWLIMLCYKYIIFFKLLTLLYKLIIWFIDKQYLLINNFYYNIIKTLFFCIWSFKLISKHITNRKYLSLPKKRFFFKAIT